MKSRTLISLVDSLNSHTNIPQILASAKNIAVVGLSDDATRDSYQIALYLQKVGYKIIPVNPKVSQVLNEKAYPDLVSIPIQIDIVNIFRKPEAVPAIVEEAIKIKAKTVWMQLGISHPEAEKKARDAGLQVVSNKCITVERRKLSNWDK